MEQEATFHVTNEVLPERKTGGVRRRNPSQDLTSTATKRKMGVVSHGSGLRHPISSGVLVSPPRPSDNNDVTESDIHYSSSTPIDTLKYCSGLGQSPDNCSSVDSGFGDQTIYNSSDDKNVKKVKVLEDFLNKSFVTPIRDLRERFGK